MQGSVLVGIGPISMIVGGLSVGSFDRSTIGGSYLSLVERLVSRRFLPEGDFRDWAAIDAWTDGIVRRLGSG